MRHDAPRGRKKSGSNPSVVRRQTRDDRDMTSERVVLFICVENAGRSLMAEAIFNSMAPVGWRAESAGTEPAAAPNPRTEPMLREIGLRPPPHPPRLLTTEAMESAARRITMGCLDRDSCPSRLKQLPLEDWALADPGKLDDAGFRNVRDEIATRVAALCRELSGE